MHRIILSAMLLVAALSLPAAQVEDCRPGQLSSLLGDTRVTELQVSGHIDARDFRFIADSLRHLTRLDLSAAVIDGYSGDRLFGNVSEYAADEVPVQSLADLTELTDLALPVRATTLGAGCLAGCRSLANVTMPLRLSHIGAYALSGCSSLTAVAVPQGLSQIGDGAFSNCAALASVSMLQPAEGDTITPQPAALTIGARAFANCPSLKSVGLGKMLRHIDAEAFAETGLEDMALDGHSGLDSIGAWALSGSQLKALTLPAGLRSLGDGALMNDDALATLTIPSATRYIGSFAMAYMTGLEQITSTPLHAPELGDSVWYGVAQGDVRLKVSPSSIDEYRSAAQWCNFLIASALRGDVNGDGIVDIADINILINIMLNKDSADRYAGRAYVTDDENVDIADINAVINIMLTKRLAARRAAEEAARRAAEQATRKAAETPAPVKALTATATESPSR